MIESSQSSNPTPSYVHNFFGSIKRLMSAIIYWVFLLQRLVTNTLSTCSLVHMHARATKYCTHAIDLFESTVNPLLKIWPRSNIMFVSNLINAVHFPLASLHSDVNRPSLAFKTFATASTREHILRELIRLLMGRIEYFDLVSSNFESKSLAPRCRSRQSGGSVADVVGEGEDLSPNSFLNKLSIYQTQRKMLQRARL